MEIKLYNTELDSTLSPIEQVLYNRGIPKNEIYHYLHKDVNDLIPYDNLSNMDKAINTVLKHITNNDKILVQVDSDVDGYTSASLLINFLRANYHSVDISYQVHDTKKHGLEMTEDILNKKYQLIIIPDAGSEEISKQKKLKELGVDLVVLDHHEITNLNEEAIIVNNQISDNYPNKALSGAGIVWKFCRAMPHFFNSANNFLDLAAVGNIADVMDMRSFETSYIVEQGLKLLNRHEGNKFLLALIDKQSFSLGEKVTPMGIAMYIAPLINAVVRVGTPEERLNIFKCFLDKECMERVPSTKRGAKEGETETLLAQGTRIVTNIKNRQTRVVDTGLEELQGTILKNFSSTNSILFLNTKDAIPRDLNGLLANKLLSKYNRPTLVASVYEVDGKLKIQGSGRSKETKVLKDFKKFINDSGLADYAQGHSNAFGFQMDLDNLNKFVEYADSKLNFTNVSNQYVVDYVFNDFYFPQNILKELCDYEHVYAPFVPVPAIAVEHWHINPTDVNFLRNNTVKIQKSNACSCIAFRVPDEQIEKLRKPCTISFVGNPSYNVYNGNKNIQIIIQELEIEE